jgi:hypothetical protein
MRNTNKSLFTEELAQMFGKMAFGGMANNAII